MRKLLRFSTLSRNYNANSRARSPEMFSNFID